MAKKCARCQKDLNFYERTYTCDYPQLGISFKDLCSDCHREVTTAVKEIDRICRYMDSSSESAFGHKSSAADLSELILLAGAGINLEVSDWRDVNSPFNVVFLGNDSKNPSETERLLTLIFRVLRYQFVASLGYQGADTLYAFLSYAGRSVRFEKDRMANFGKQGKKEYTDILVTADGITLLEADGQTYLLGLKKDEQFRAELLSTGISFDIECKGLLWPDTHRSLLLSFTRKEQAVSLLDFLNAADQRKDEMVEKKHKLLLEKINAVLEKDLSKSFPDKRIEAIDIEAVLMLLTRILIEKPYDAVFDGKEPEGLLETILDTYYRRNLRSAGFKNGSEASSAVTKNFLFVPSLYLSENGGQAEETWALFAPKGILGNRDGTFYFESRDHFPNSLYHPLREIIFRGEPWFFLDRGNLDGGGAQLKGLFLQIEDMDSKKAFERFAKHREIDYLRDEERKLTLRRSRERNIDKSVAAQAEQLLTDFGLLPFVSEASFISIEDHLRKIDPLFLDRNRPVKRRVDRKNTLDNKPLMHEYERSVMQLAGEWKTESLPPVRLLLWEALKTTVLEEADEEFERILPDLLQKGMTLTQAVKTFLQQDTVDTSLDYILGLFALALIKREILPMSGYLDARDAVKDQILINLPSTFQQRAEKLREADTDETSLIKESEPKEDRDEEIAQGEVSAQEIPSDPAGPVDPISDSEEKSGRENLPLDIGESGPSPEDEEKKGSQDDQTEESKEE